MPTSIAVASQAVVGYPRTSLPPCRSSRKNQAGYSAQRLKQMGKVDALLFQPQGRRKVVESGTAAGGIVDLRRIEHPVKPFREALFLAIMWLFGYSKSATGACRKITTD